jgi:hypothetical protein
VSQPEWHFKKKIPARQVELSRHLERSADFRFIRVFRVTPSVGVASPSGSKAALQLDTMIIILA